jgi:hypothetical protein
MKAVRSALLTLLLLIIVSPAHAIKIEGGSFAGSFHLGLVSGPGLGINFGLDGGVPAGDFLLGGEIEQIVTDHDFDVSINARKFGLMARYYMMEKTLSAALHLGTTEFSISKDTTFKDALTSKSERITGTELKKASYVAFSLDYYLGQYMITPKICMNYLEEGSLLEFDLNLGHTF